MNVDDTTYSAMLEQANLPAEMIGMLTMIQQGIREGGLENNLSDLEMLLGRKPAGVKEALQQLLAINQEGYMLRLFPPPVYGINLRANFVLILPQVPPSFLQETFSI